MSLKKPTVIIFDMDGTTVRHINPRLLHILEKVDDVMYWAGGRFRKREFTKTPKKKRPHLLVHRALHKFRRKPVEQIVEPCLGVREVLEYIQELGIPTAIVSNGLGRGYGYDILEKFNLARFFKAKIFREDFVEAKPHPEPLLNALKAMNLNITPRDVIWCIGDRRKDIIAAIALQKILGCSVEPLSYGIDAAISILNNHYATDHILTSYSDLELKLRELFKNEARHEIYTSR